VSNEHKATTSALRDGINPKTGRPWTLADPDVKRELAAELEAMRRNPEKARQFLKDIGIHTATGRLAKRYGG
jgi:hypothetical protein